MEVQRLYRVKESDEHSYGGRLVELDEDPDLAALDGPIISVVTYDKQQLKLWFYPFELEDA